MRTRTTIRTLSLLALIALAAPACHADATVPLPEPVAPVAVQKVSGDAQVGAVTLRLGAPLVARAYRDTTHGASRTLIALEAAHSATDTTATFSLGVPLRNTLISFVVPDAACGRPFSNSETTDSLGMVKQLWTAGTRASATCTMEARAVDQTTGLPITYATFTATFRASAVSTFNLTTNDTTLHAGDSLAVAALVKDAHDQYGNLNAAYLLRYRRINVTDSLSDPAPVATAKARLRAGDTFLVVHVDSTTSNVRVRVLP